MGGEDQLKALIRHGFALQNTADKAVLRVDKVLAQSMANVKRLIEQLPEDSLLRNQSWKQIQPMVQQELKVYGDQLGSAVADALVDAAPDMEKAAVRQAQLGGADFGPEYVRMNPAGGRVADTVEMALRSQVSGKTIKKLFNLDGKSERSAVDKALFRTVDTRVRAGIIEGKTTEQIARDMVADVQRQGVPGVSLSTGVSKQVRGQAMAIARTATQDMARQVKNQVYDANADAMEGMVWLWTAALDSKTCETCGPLDGQRWDTQKEAPTWPLHPNCRCQVLPIDPDDDFWNEPEITAQQIRPVKEGRYSEKEKGAYKTPITVKGKKYYRKAVTVTSDTPPPRYSDVLAKWATGSQESLKAALGPQRADFFTKQFNQFNKDPQQILEAMLTGKSGAQKWIPVEKLQTVKVGPKPKPKVLAKPKPKAKPKAAVPASTANYDYQAAKAKLQAKKAAQAKADKAALAAAKASKGPSAKAQVKKLQNEKNAGIAAKAKAKEETIKSLQVGDDVTFAAAGSYGKGVVYKKADLLDPKLPVGIKAKADGPYWKKGDVIPANKNKGFISKGDPPKEKGFDSSGLSKAELESKKKAEAFFAKANAKNATPAPKSKAPSKPKFRTVDTNYDYDKNWEKLGYETKAKYRKVKTDVVDWSGEDFEGVRAAQFHKIQKAGGELNAYEKLQVRRLESGEARRFGSMADRLENFVERAPKFDGELRRGVALNKPEEVQDLIERYSKGEKNKALESWTSEKSVSDRFASGNRFPKAHRVSIVVENNTRGAPINAISGFDDEFEILVPSGVRYEVVEVKETFVKGIKGANPADAMDHTDYVVKLREVAD